MNKKAIILCVLFSVIFLVLGIFIGILFQKSKSIETSYSKEEAEDILKEYKKNESDDELFNKAQNASDNWNSMKNQADEFDKQINQLLIETFNVKFTPYEGENQSASQIRALISAVKSSNLTDKDHQITLDPSDISSNLKSTKKYSVKINYDNDGYINKISIKEDT